MNKFKTLKAQKEANKMLYVHYKELFEAGVKELRFEKLRAEHLLGALQEIKEMTNDHLTKKLIKNEIERDNIDKLIHYRTIF